MRNLARAVKRHGDTCAGAAHCGEGVRCGGWTATKDGGYEVEGWLTVG